MLSRAGHAIGPKERCSAPARSLLRYLDAERGDRLLVVNLGCDLDFTPAREPLLAPPSMRAGAWRGAAKRRDYGGQGVAPLDPDGPWRIPGGSAMFFVPEPR